MACFVRLILSLFMLSVFVAPMALADVPSTLSYQGILTDGAGTPVNGNKEIAFNLYTAPTGGNPFWTEIQTVIIHDGKFSVTLGAGKKKLNMAKFTGDTYIGIKVGADSEMPRQQFRSVVYALKSADAPPKNAIIMWHGDPAKIPSGWALCDGKNGTPDLRGMFIVGAGIEGTDGNQYKLGDKGGTNSNDTSHTHSIAADSPGTSAAGDHQHTFSGDTGTPRNDNHTVDDQDDNNQRDMSGAGHYHSFSGTTSGAGGHSHTVNPHSHGAATGISGPTALENRPPYYALMFIMKL